MSTIENLEHSLSTINTIGSKFDDILEKKKNEVIAAAGGVAAAKELVELHKEFLTKSKETITEDAKTANLPQQITQYILNCLKQSHDVLEKFVLNKTATYNNKMGEVNAFDLSVKVLKNFYDAAESKKIQEVQKLIDVKKENVDNPAEVKKDHTETVQSELHEQEQPKEQKKKRGRTPKKQVEKLSEKQPEKKIRPDERSHVASTVKRLKDSRKKSQK